MPPPFTMDPTRANIPPPGEASSNARPPARDKAPCPPAGGEAPQDDAPPSPGGGPGLQAAFSLEESKAFHDGHSSQGAHPSCSPLLLSQLEPSQCSIGHFLVASTDWTSVGPSTNIPVMLCIAPPMGGGKQGFIFFDPNERVHQEALLAYFNSAGPQVFLLPCLDFTNFLQTHFLTEHNITFVTDLPDYILQLGR
jgi:hypothetical protein